MLLPITINHLKDDSRTHLLEELATRVRNLPILRPVHLVLENEENEAFRLNRNASQTAYDASQVFMQSRTEQFSDEWCAFLCRVHDVIKEIRI